MALDLLVFSEFYPPCILVEFQVFNQDAGIEISPQWDNFYRRELLNGFFLCFTPFYSLHPPLTLKFLRLFCGGRGGGGSGGHDGGPIGNGDEMYKEVENG